MGVWRVPVGDAHVRGSAVSVAPVYTQPEAERMILLFYMLGHHLLIKAWTTYNILLFSLSLFPRQNEFG